MAASHDSSRRTRWKGGRKPSFASSFAFAVLLSLCTITVTIPLRAESPQYIRSITNRLNPTDRVITIPIPIKDGDTLLGEVTTQVKPDDTLLLSLSELRERLQSSIGAEARRSLERLASHRAFAQLEEIRSAGVAISFDTGLQELRLDLPVELRPTGEISIAHNAARAPNAQYAPPAVMSGYINVFAGLDYAWGTEGAGGWLSGSSSVGHRYGLESAARLYGIVMENRALYEGDVDVNICPTGARCIFQHQPGFKRQTSRLLYDLPDQHMRLTFGDADPLALPGQRSIEMLGISLEKSAHKLAPGEVASQTGRTALRIERPSVVDVLVNGVMVQQLRLRPGSYNIRDLPLATGANEIRLDIVDDTGARRSQTFTTFGATNLLKPGASEWAITAGAPSYLRDSERAYDLNERMASGYLRYGIHDTLTGEAHVQADSMITMGGLGARMATGLGAFGLQGAASNSALGLGWSAQLNWDVIGFSGLLSDRGENFSLAAEYRGTNFFRPGDRYVAATGILFPEFNYWLRLSASYSTRLSYTMGLSLSARYQFADEKQPTF